MKHLFLVLAFSGLWGGLATAQTPHSVTVSWACTGGCATDGSPIGFEVDRSTTSGGPYVPVSPVAPLSPLPFTAMSFVDTLNLVEGQQYFYVIKTLGPGGAVLAPSNEASATIPKSIKPPVQGPAVAK